MTDIRKEIEKLIEQQIKIEQENREELKRREGSYRSLQSEIHSKIKEIDSKKSSLYSSLIEEGILKHTTDFSNIKLLEVYEYYYDEDIDDDECEYNKFRNISSKDFKVKKYLELEASIKPMYNEWADFELLIYNLSNNKDINIIEHKTDGVAIANKGNNDVFYWLHYNSILDLLEIRKETENDEGSCILNVFFSI